MQKLKVHHLSHIDLDGYGCQLVAKNYFENIEFYNSNYGKEIEHRLKTLMANIQKENIECMILITDLNLTRDQAKNLDEWVKTKDNVTILLLDHHITGKFCSQTYDWYFLDDKRCATLITYEYFSFKYGANEELELFSKVVNAVDIWKDRDQYFELGKVCMKLISDAREINKNMFPRKNVEYRFSLMKGAMNYFTSAKANIKLDDKIHQLKKNFFKIDKNDTLDNLVANYMVKLLAEKQDDLTIYFNGQKGLLTWGVGSISVIGNLFLVKNPEFAFFIDISSKKAISLRANNRLDVAQLAKDLAGGGGHKNASGAYIKNLKDSFEYKDLKKQISGMLKEVEIRTKYESIKPLSNGININI